ncbi:hypothetical protein GQR58_019909 [Nymphon striatum]|nr:hypothetical protein GQR58_019909 [Nymphon striatum]
MPVRRRCTTGSGGDMLSVVTCCHIPSTDDDDDDDENTHSECTKRRMENDYSDEQKLVQSMKNMIKKCEGVRGKGASRSSDTYVKERLFTMNSTSHNKVENSRFVRVFPPKIFLSVVVTVRIMRSQKPPHHGVRGTMKDHSILLDVSKGSFEAFTNVVPLSDIILCGIPLLQMNRVKHSKNSSVVRESTNSKCIALVVAQVNKQI